MTEGNKNNEPSFAGLFIVTIAALAVVYWTLPNYFLHWNYRTAQASLVALDSTSLTYEYENTFDGRLYTFQRDLSSADYQKIKAADTLTAVYPHYFPEHTIVEQVDKKRPVLVTLVIHLAVVLAIYKSAKELIKAPREESSIKA